MAEIALQRDEKQALFEQQKLAEAAELDAARSKDAFRAQVVEAARRQLLKEHAAVLVRGGGRGERRGEGRLTSLSLPLTSLPLLPLLLQRGGGVPRGVILSQADLDLLKAFDRDGDGHLQPAEMELAQAAFKAYDVGQGGAGRGAAASSVPAPRGGPGGTRAAAAAAPAPAVAFPGLGRR